MKGGMCVFLTGEEKREILRQVRGNMLERSAIQREIEEISAMAEASTSRMRAVPVGATKKVDRVADGGIKLAEATARMDEAIRNVAQQIDVAMDIIEQVPDSIDRVILRCYYIEAMTWLEVAGHVDYDERSCRRRRNFALGLEEDCEDVLVCPPTTAV